ncbi:MAG TPA: ABC transporter permease [Cyclobacteriaceae bacterium]|jgi:putative ABC transport system permease protein|nr:ABC transporter permease [Cyclobacteriaceae bacterium]
MLRHYLTTAFRNFLRNKFYTTITVVGLAFGITSVFLIIQYLKSELSYDRFHEGAENIYRVAWINTNPQTRTPHPMAQAMVRDFPEVEQAVSLTPIWGPGLTRQVFTVRNPEKNVRYDESSVLAVDSTFFQVFSFPLIKGNPKAALRDPGGVLISEKTALKYFGTVDCLGKQLEANEEKSLIEVVGVFKDVPSTSHFHFDFLTSYVREKSSPNDPYYQWTDFGHFNYVRLKPGTDAKELEKKLLAWSRKYVNFSDEDFRWLSDHHYGFQLQPITSIHLQSHLRWELEPNGNIAYVYLMTAAALLILIIGAVNFVNLNIAQASERAKEIGLRKSLGAFRQQLISQFLGESVLVTLMAVALSVVLIEISIPLFYGLTGKTLTIDRGVFFVALLSLGIVVALITGIYPALFMSAAKPALILKNKMFQTKGIGTRRVFIVFQFVTSMGLISASAIISQQLDFLQHKDLGFQPEEVLVIPIKDRSMNRRLPELRNELLKTAGVTGVSATSNIPGKSFNQNSIFTIRNPEERRDASEVMVDADFANVMNIKVAEGRFFSSGSLVDSGGFVLNQTAVNQLGIKDPVGKEIVWERDGPIVKGPILGVVQDFNFQSLHEPMRPLLMFMEPRFNFAVVKVNTSDFKSTIGAIEKSWRKFDDRFQFEFSFLNDQLNQLYIEEQNVVSVLKIFSLLGVIIASLGLLGIAALAFRQRTKEISVRKVLGASWANLVLLLVRDFTKLVLIAVVLAVPLVWWIMNGWLENFSYRINVSPLVFVFTGLGLIAISWLTLSFLTIKTAQINPAETLKSE